MVPNSLQEEYNRKSRFIELDKIQHTELFEVWKKTNDNPALSKFLAAN